MSEFMLWGWPPAKWMCDHISFSMYGIFFAIVVAVVAGIIYHEGNASGIEETLPMFFFAPVVLFIFIEVLLFAIPLIIISCVATLVGISIAYCIKHRKEIIDMLKEKK